MDCHGTAASAAVTAECLESLCLFNLTDFGEYCSDLIQTASILHHATDNVELQGFETLYGLGNHTKLITMTEPRASTFEFWAWPDIILVIHTARWTNRDFQTPQHPINPTLVLHAPSFQLSYQTVCLHSQSNRRLYKVSLQSSKSENHDKGTFFTVYCFLLHHFNTTVQQQQIQSRKLNQKRTNAKNHVTTYIDQRLRQGRT